MCGRYELHAHPAAIALAFGLSRPPHLAARYNIAPMTDVPVVRVGATRERELAHMRWGLVPRWARDASIGAKLINARGETLAVRRAFEMPYRRHRCLIPANGFYEWLAVAASSQVPAHKRPMHVGMKDGELFGMGGLCERWLSPDGEVLDTCTIVTTDSNDLVRPIHDRMPLILAPRDYERWLDPARADVRDLIAPYPSSEMSAYPVSMRVNSARHDDASLIEHDARGDIEVLHDAHEPAPEPEQESLF